MHCLIILTYVAILLQHECLSCAGGKIGEGEGLVVNGKRKRPKEKQMEEGGPKKKPRGQGERSKKEHGGNPNPMTKILKVSVHSLFHVPKMQFQPTIDD